VAWRSVHLISVSVSISISVTVSVSVPVSGIAISVAVSISVSVSVSVSAAGRSRFARARSGVPLLSVFARFNQILSAVLSLALTLCRIEYFPFHTRLFLAFAFARGIIPFEVRCTARVIGLFALTTA